MSQENVERVRKAFGHWRETGEWLEEGGDPGFVWDMSTFRGWPEKQVYRGSAGAMEFLENWLQAWEDWEIDCLRYVDAGDRIVQILRQKGRSKATGLPTEMEFGQVWVFEEGEVTRTQMYASPGEALEAAGLRE